VLSVSPEEIKCVASVPPADSFAIADENMDYPITDEGYRFRGMASASVVYFPNKTSLCNLEFPLHYLLVSIFRVTWGQLLPLQQYTWSTSL
jgi:hypothetical protein